MTVTDGDGEKLYLRHHNLRTTTWRISLFLKGDVVVIEASTVQ